MQKNQAAVCALVAILGATLALAQGAPQPPKPGPEQQRLHYFVGQWKTTGETKPGPFGPAGKFTSTEEAHMLGDFWVASHANGTSPMGSIEELSVIGYDPKQNAYTFDAYNSLGMHEHATGHVSGTTWTWTSDEDMGGKKVLGRFVLIETSPTSYTMKFDSSTDNGKTWTNMMEGTATKVK